jgi:hypothetical protein
MQMRTGHSARGTNLAEDKGTLYVGFERIHAIMRFDY